MTAVRKLARLTPAERGLLLRALLAVCVFRVGLTVLPFRWVERLAARPRARTNGGARPSVDQLAWAVSAASRRIPRATCLTQALALQSLLIGEGHEPTLRLGVAKTPVGDLEAHAWLEHGGRIVIGGPQSARFTPLPLPSRLDS
jgi:hypothetical protein